MSKLADTAPVNGAAEYKWTLQLYEKRGHCWVTFRTNSPFRAQQGQIHLFAGEPPADDPTGGVAWCWDSDFGGPVNQGDWDTGQLWGTGWSAAWIAEKQVNGPYVYACKTPVTS